MLLSTVTAQDHACPLRTSQRVSLLEEAHKDIVPEVRLVADSHLQQLVLLYLRQQAACSLFANFFGLCTNFEQLLCLQLQGCILAQVQKSLSIKSIKHASICMLYLRDINTLQCQRHCA